MLKESRNLQKHKKTPEEEKEFVKNIITTTPPIYDQFTLTPGVTLSMNGKLKVEPRPITATLANITDPMIRMSKTDYFNLTRTGNLSREVLAKTLDLNNKLQIGHKLGKISEEPSYQSGISKELKEKKMKKKQLDTIGEIKVSSQLMIETMTRNMNKEEDFMNIKRLQEEHRRKMEEVEARKEKDFFTSPVDKFNLDIISSKDWGRSTFGSNVSGNQMKHMNKPSNKDMKESLGVMMKKPRERGVGNVNSNKRLPPPMVGRTIGHGFANTMGQDSFNLPENI